MSSTDSNKDDLIENVSTNTIEDEEYPKNVYIMKSNNQLRELHTLLRDRTTCRSDFKFYADRLIRLTVEAALDQLPYIPCEIITPTGHSFNGLRHEKGTLCVSLMRSGEAMEKGIRECCRSIRIGKILINEGQVIYAKLPADTHRRRILVTYPVITTGSTVLTGLEVLLTEYQCKQSNIILITLFATHDGLKQIYERYPDIKIVVSEINEIAPNHFGQKYFEDNHLTGTIEKLTVTASSTFQNDIISDTSLELDGFIGKMEDDYHEQEQMEQEREQ
ncbi:unnamed protein product [Rotaria sp. Silwood1]|nr:unnamed protein product [Rotaria sp. Silwood1]CAF0960950.1 unnamed protein product [Rotaria sp. Silwood1]